MIHIYIKMENKAGGFSSRTKPEDKLTTMQYIWHWIFYLLAFAIFVILFGALSSKKYKHQRMTEEDALIEIKSLDKRAQTILVVAFILKQTTMKQTPFNRGDKVIAINTAPLKGTVAPPLELDKEYEILEITLDKEKNEHFDVGLRSEHNYVTSIETGEELPRSDKVHWCHPSRFKASNHGS